MRLPYAIPSHPDPHPWGYSVLLAFALVFDFSKIFSIGSYVSQGIVCQSGWLGGRCLQRHRLIDGMCATQQFNGRQLTDVGDTTSAHTRCRRAKMLKLRHATRIEL